MSKCVQRLELECERMSLIITCKMTLPSEGKLQRARGSLTIFSRTYSLPRYSLRVLYIFRTFIFILSLGRVFGPWASPFRERGSGWWSVAEVFRRSNPPVSSPIGPMVVSEVIYCTAQIDAAIHICILGLIKLHAFALFKDDMQRSWLFCGTEGKSCAHLCCNQNNLVPPSINDYLAPVRTSRCAGLKVFL